MSDELTIQCGISLNNATTGKQYQSRPTRFLADSLGAAGPVPGTVLVATAGTNIDLSGLTSQGGWARFQNLDPANYVEFGVYAGSTFYPLGELGPGEICVLRLSRDVLYGGSGTAVTQSLRFRANTSPCYVLVEAFDP